MHRSHSSTAETTPKLCCTLFSSCLARVWEPPMWPLIFQMKKVTTSRISWWESQSSLGPSLCQKWNRAAKVKNDTWGQEAFAIIFYQTTDLQQAWLCPHFLLCWIIFLCLYGVCSSMFSELPKLGVTHRSILKPLLPLGSHTVMSITDRNLGENPRWPAPALAPEC